MDARRGLRPLLAVATAFPAGVAILSVANVVAPQRDGPLALSQILAPHLVAATLLFVPLALLRGGRALRVALAVAIVLGVVRFGAGLVSLPGAAPAPDAATLRLLAWNLEVGAPDPADVIRVVIAANVDVVAFEELTPDIADALTADPTLAGRYPGQAMFPEPGTGGIGILSRRPLSAAVHRTAPIAAEADLDLGGATVHVIAGHPYPAAIRTVSMLRLPIDFDAERRDRDVARFRGWIDPFVAANRPLVVIGDFNLTDREPAYGVLAKGLLDAHLEVGQGPGSTWRPDRMKFLPFGVLRIDYVLTGGGVRAIASGEDCTPRASDHCIVVATVTVPIDPAA
ncbi:MAG TPA: endonuclease/exonuclease/phosphatase family protein [Candidatus Limnocylindrales bacterium]|nr:endonuclease/exonuclease/phosphatase family protein [Candidatus Limnocylindrales bacterium]